MYAQMGMKIEEWEDGQVNVGVAVCPTKPTAIAAALADTKKGRMLMASAPSGDFIVVPKSAFIIQSAPQDQSQGGVSITYAHRPRGPSNFIIMLNPQDQGLFSGNREQDFQERSNTDIIDTEIMKPGSGESIAESTGDNSQSNPNISESKENHNDVGLEGGVENEGNSSLHSGESQNLRTPQDGNNDDKPEEALERQATGSSEKEGDFPLPFHTKRLGSDMKRVSWVEEVEKSSQDNKGTGNSGKENRKENVRKLNGKGNSSSSNNNINTRNTLKQHGALSEDATSGTITEENAKGCKRSGDKSRIPLITASAGDYPTSCEFYRRQMLRECMSYNPSTMADNWYGYGASLQKYAGQKVVKKIAAEQKRLEEDISNRRKTEIWILGNESEDLMMSPVMVPLRKRTMRLKPMQFVQ